MANPNPALFKRKGQKAGADAATAAKAAAAAPTGPTSSEMAETPTAPVEAPSPAVAAEPEVELGAAVPGLPPAGVYGAQGDTWRYMLSTDGSIKVQDSTKGGPWIDVQEGTDAYTNIVNQLRGDDAILKLGEGAAAPEPEPEPAPAPEPEAAPGSDESVRRAVDEAVAEANPNAIDPYRGYGKGRDPEKAAARRGMYARELDMLDKATGKFGSDNPSTSTGSGLPPIEEDGKGPGPDEQDAVNRQRLFEDIRTALFGRR